jgi:chromosomal replication initiator protein
MKSNYLNPNFTFERFACGSCNQFAFSSAHDAAATLGAIANPLILYGDHGLGKSHLLHAIGNQHIAGNPAAQVIYCSADVFMDEMIECLKSNQMDCFRRNFYSADLLLIDDVQRIAHKMRTQQELLRLFDKFNSRHVPMVFAMNQHPSKLEGLDDALHSRFSGGLLVELSVPDYATKRAILNKIAVRNRVTLLEEVADFMANIHVRNIRELEGMLIRLGTYSSLTNVEISLPLAMKYLQDMTKALAP